MDRPPDISHLDPARIDQAYALVFAVRPALSLAEWRRRAWRLLDPATPERGIVAAERRGVLRGLFSYEVEATPIRVLAVDDVAVLEVVGRNSTAATLAAEAERVAGRLGCGGIDVRLDSEMEGLWSEWQSGFGQGPPPRLCRVGNVLPMRPYSHRRHRTNSNSTA
jgi:hypothetical protein